MLGFQIFKSVANYPLSGDELLGILKKISIDNKEQHITGMLIYSEHTFKNKNQGRFIQIVEGDSSVLGVSVQLSMTEEYHKDLTLVKKGIVLDRDFPDWSMGFDSGKLNKRIDLQSYFDFTESLKELEIKNEAMSALGIMKTFYDQQKNRERVLRINY